MTATAPTVQNLIANEYVAGSTGETEPILNPATGEVIAQRRTVQRGRCELVPSMLPQAPTRAGLRPLPGSVRSRC